MKQVKKALLLVGGKGTRVMPLTLHQPKGMIALADKPMVHYAIDELVASGISEIVIVHSPGQEVFKQYINHLQKDQEWNSHVKFHFAVQKKPLGDGDAVMSAKKFIKRGEPFAVAFCDDIFAEKQPSLQKIIQHFSQKGLPTILCAEVPHHHVNRYGVARLGNSKKKNFYSIIDFIEKPEPDQAPSNLVFVGRCILPYKILSYLEKLYTDKSYPEIRIAYALKSFINDHKEIWGFSNPKTIRFDCGSKEGLVQAQAYFALRHPHIKSRLNKILI